MNAFLLYWVTIFLMISNFYGLDAKLTFASKSSSIVLADSSSKLKIESINNVSGWQSQSLIKTSGHNNTWMSPNTTYGYGIGETNPDTYLVYSNSNAINSLSRTYSAYTSQPWYNTDTTVNNLTFYKNGFAVKAGATLTLTTPLPVNGPISLEGTLSLGGDLYLESGTTFTNLGRLNGNGYSLNLSGDLPIPSNKILHIGSNTSIEGNGNIISLGDNSELFVDANVTLTLRNLTVISSKNGVGNPAIKLSANSSKLTLENVKLNFVDDFYFTRGQLFVQNDVKFTGTSAFVYQSTQQSFISSGANLTFDTGTTFSFAPSTFTSCPYTTNPTYISSNFINMQDKTSKITFNGSDFYTTLTGLRLTNGEIDFGNKVNIRSQATNSISAANPATSIGYASASIGTTYPSKMSWSPNGRFVALVNYNANQLSIFSFTGSGDPVLVGSPVGTDAGPIEANWSPDGKFVAVANRNTPSLQIFNVSSSGVASFAGEAPTQAIATAAKWSPDGKFVAVIKNTNPGLLQIFGVSLSGIPTLIDTASTADFAWSVDWSPDGKFLAVVTNFYYSSNLQIFSISTNGNPALVTTTGIGSNGQPTGVNWSPDGRFVAIVNSYTNAIQIYRFTGSGSLTYVGGAGTASTPYSVKWSPDGQYLAVIPTGSSVIHIYKFTGNGNPVFINNINTLGTSPSYVDWSLDGKYLAVINHSGSTYLQIFAVNYINNTQTQNMSNSIVLGDSSAGSASDLSVKLMSGANVQIDGILNYDNVLGGTMFSSDNSRFVLKDSNSKIKINPGTVIGWQARSLIKNELNVGQGDYNLQNYSGGDKTVTFTEASGELVYNNSNSIVRLNVTAPNVLVLQNSNAINYLTPLLRTDSNAFAYGIQNNSNAIVKLAASSPNTLVIQNSNAINYWSPINRGTSNATSWLSTRVRTDSNAFVYGIRNNSNAINYLSLYGDPALTRNVSNSVVYWSPINRDTSNATSWLSSRVRTDSNAFAYEIRNNSNAIIKLNGTSPVTLVIQNSNAIVRLNSEVQTIDHGPDNIIISTPTHTMSYDYFLSTDHVLQIQNSCVIDGNNHSIYFAKNSTSLVQIAAGSTVVLTNITLENFSDIAIQLDLGASLVFGDQTRINLNDGQTLSTPWIFQGDTTIHGSYIIVGGQSVQIMQGGTLTLEETGINDVEGNNVRCVGNSTIRLLNSALYLSNNYSLTCGAMEFWGDAGLSGSYLFNYNTDQASTVIPGSALYLYGGIIFNYSPITDNRDLIVLQDASSGLHLNGCILGSTTTGMRLTKGYLVVDGQNSVFNSATSVSQATCFGNGSAADDLSVSMREGASLTVASGILDYQNVN